MSISENMKSVLAGSSSIRKMFEEGERLRKIYGADRVYDFSLGNPCNEPPAAFQKVLQELAARPIKGMHGYMLNSGYPHTRQAVAEAINRESGKSLTFEHVVMTVGASGGINAVLKTLLDPGDEVIIMVPYFVDYKFYIGNHGGEVKMAKTREDFQLDIDNIAAAITPKTKAIMINTPNNPTGVIYSAESLDRLNELIEAKGAAYGRQIYVICDQPYARIIFDGLKLPHIFQHLRNGIIVTSFSKDLALAGERIGYVAVNPEADDSDQITKGLSLANRILGFTNAPALMQWLVEGVLDETVDIGEYQEKRDLFYYNLTAMGYEMVKPQGTFYLFPKSPFPDEMEFIALAHKHNLLVVPGSSFGRPGYFRIAFCCDRDLIERSLPIFQQVAEECGLKARS